MQENDSIQEEVFFEEEQDNVVEQEEQEEKELSPLEQIAEVLAASGMEDAPTLEILQAWKRHHKNIRTLTVAPDAIFIFRTLTRSEYRRIMSLPESIRRANEKADEDEIRSQMEDEICSTAVLFPKNIVELTEQYGGLSKTLSDQITIESYFIPAEIASAFVTKL